MDDEAALLRKFAQEGCEDAFARLVQCHVGMVFATALRRVGGDTHLAEDVTQSVFIDLARKAPALLHHRMLAAWLHTSAVFAAAKVVRTEQRRRRREEHAHMMQDLAQESSSDAEWTRVRPVLDDALQALPTRDRELILLRFFSARGFGEIGRALRVSEGAARMRVDRALGRLRRQLARRGIGSTLAALATALSTHGVAVPPAAFTGAMTSAALSGAASVSAVTSFFNFLAMTKAQVSLAAAVAVAGITTVGLQQWEIAGWRATIARGAAITNESSHVRAEIARLQQTEADFQALHRRGAELARIRQELAELRARRAEIEAQLAARSYARQAEEGGGAGTPLPDTPRPGGLDQWPRPVRTVSVQYPETLRPAAIPGEVLIAFVVDADGRVQDPTVIESTHPDFVAPALESIAQWQFDAGTKGGKSVNTRIRLPVVFAVENPNWF